MRQDEEMTYEIVCLDSAPADVGDMSWQSVRQSGTLTLYARTAPDEILERARDASVIITNKVKLNAETLRQLPKLKLICVLATGYDIIDIDAARRAGITVCNVPGYSTASTAQLAISLLLELAWGVGSHSDAVHAGEWSRQQTFAYWRRPLVELDGKTLVIAGFGSIGGRCAKIAEALGMKVIAAQLPGRPDSEDRVAFRDALGVADALSLHCPLNSDTHHLLNDTTIAQLKPGCLVVNTGRGPLVDSSAIRRALESGHVGGFATDVMTQEPPPIDEPLIGAPRTIITPHTGWATREARTRLIEATGANIRAFLEGSPQNVVS